MSLEQIILIAARKLPASNLLATAAANLLSSDVFPLFLLLLFLIIIIVYTTVARSSRDFHRADDRIV